MTAIVSLGEKQRQNVLEACRALNAKFDPQNGAAATRTVIRLVDAN